MAREQGALFWELRAALSLARLKATQGRPEAKRVLTPVYDRFTEGFETADLRAARAMLELPMTGFAAVPGGEVRFAPDSPLEGAVTSELVSEAKFPASWENTGNFVRLGPRTRLLNRNQGINSMVYNQIPYASEQGIYFDPAGN
jgi:hypothetical protein